MTENSHGGEAGDRFSFQHHVCYPCYISRGVYKKIHGRFAVSTWAQVGSDFKFMIMSRLLVLPSRPFVQEKWRKFLRNTLEKLIGACIVIFCFRVHIYIYISEWCFKKSTVCFGMIVRAKNKNGVIIVTLRFWDNTTHQKFSHWLIPRPGLFSCWFLEVLI